MRMTLATWDGHNINDTTYKSYNPLGIGNGQVQGTPNYIDLGNGKPPYLSGVALAGSSFTFSVRCLGTTDVTRETQKNTLFSWFVPGSTAKYLVGTDDDNGNKDWYLYGRVTNSPILVPNSVHLYQITIALVTPYWIENDLNTNTWIITATTETEVMANVGNYKALPKFALTPATAKGSNAIGFKRYYAVHTSGWGGVVPVDITSAALDTDALITAGKMLASGDDLIVTNKGVAIPRFLNGLDTASTSVWSYIPFTPAPGMRLYTALDNSTTPAEITVDYGLLLITGEDNVNNLVENSAILIGTEVITYSTFTKDEATRRVTFIPVLRGAKGSTKAAHSVGDSVYWLENDIWISYGNPDAPAYPDISDDAPVFDLATSSNSLWSYLLFTAGDVTQAYQQPPYISGAGSGEYYSGTHGTHASPADVVGIKLVSVYQNGRVIPVNQLLSWVFSHPGGIENFTANGEKYRSGTEFGTLSLIAGATTYYTEAAPSADTTWEDITIDQDLADNPKQLQFRYRGALGTTLPLPFAYAELSDAALTIYDPPASVAVVAEQVAYNFNGYLKNSTTGDIIYMNNILTKTAETVYINCETQEAYSTDGQRLRGNISFGGSARDEWMTLEPGNNSIVFYDVGTSEVCVVTTWRGRNTI